MTEENLTTDISHARERTDPVSVVRDPMMSIEAKRALLASWASDARAVSDHPALRRLDDGSLVAIDDVLGALKQLDGLPAPDADRRETLVTPLRHGHWSRLARQWRRGRDDDDDPPPAPASMPPFHPVWGGSLEAAA